MKQGPIHWSSPSLNRCQAVRRAGRATPVFALPVEEASHMNVSAAFCHLHLHWKCVRFRSSVAPKPRISV
jgi:hypothetical protein